MPILPTVATTGYNREATFHFLVVFTCREESTLLCAKLKLQNVFLEGDICMLQPCKTFRSEACLQATKPGPLPMRQHE